MKISENILLANYTTFRIGGRARYFCIVENEKDLKEANKFAKDNLLQVFVLGEGSNILIKDEGFSGLIIKNEIKGIKEDGKIGVGAGENWDDFVSFCVSRGYWGVENLSLIPGTVGACPVQNIGAYGVEVSDVIHSVEVFDLLDNSKIIFSNNQCGFSYRNSIFKEKRNQNKIITKVVFNLSKKPNPKLEYKDIDNYFKDLNIAEPGIEMIRDAVIKIRNSKFPDMSLCGTAGSFWKNPIIPKSVFESLKKKYTEIPSYDVDDFNVKIPLAWILDNICGLKGCKLGRVSLFLNQPLVLVTEIGATKDEVEKFAEYVESIVKGKTGINIEKEVSFV